MRRIIIIILISAISTQLIAQNEARFGIFAGVNYTSLMNSKDKAFGDYLPTFKPTLGIEAGYHFTLFKTLPLGFSVQLSNNKTGQNYHGNYADSTSYYAYSRLNYIRPGAALHFGTNPRRLVALSFSVGATLGFLTNYQEKFELIRYNNDRMIIDIKNTDVMYYDTVKIKGSLTAQMYNKTDMTVFGSMGFDVMLSKRMVFGVYGRYDMGMKSVENRNSMKINMESEPPTSIFWTPYNLDVKYRGPIDLTAKREDTKNVFYGVYFSLKYRIFNSERIEFYYKEHKWD